ncbi:AMP-binding protein, partial [Actinoplanes sp. NPDC051633]|uniref:AMP-binding protein n=1 Tax=Actinoplanes sp. NPDC051633 TaxID=3155670 RepID=UPI0034460066
MESNLARLAVAALDRLGDHPSVFFEGAWVGSAEQLERASRLASGLVRLGVRPGDRVVVMMANSPEVVQLYHAVWRAGAVVTPVIFLVTAPELRHILDDARASVVFTTPEILPKVLQARGELPLPVVVLGGSTNGETMSFADFASNTEPLSIVDRSPDQLAA